MLKYTRRERQRSEKTLIEVDIGAYPQEFHTILKGGRCPDPLRTFLKEGPKNPKNF